MVGGVTCRSAALLWSLLPGEGMPRESFESAPQSRRGGFWEWAPVQRIGGGRCLPGGMAGALWVGLGGVFSFSGRGGRLDLGADRWEPSGRNGMRPAFGWESGALGGRCRRVILGAAALRRCWVDHALLCRGLVACPMISSPSAYGKTAWVQCRCIALDWLASSLSSPNCFQESRPMSCRLLVESLPVGSRCQCGLC